MVVTRTHHSETVSLNGYVERGLVPPSFYADLQSEQERVLYYIKTLGGKEE